VSIEHGAECDYRVTAGQLSVWCAETWEAAQALLEALAETGASVAIERWVPAGGWNEAEGVNDDGFAWEFVTEAHPAGHGQLNPLGDEPQAARFVTEPGDLVRVSGSKVGDRVRLIRTSDPHTSLAPGPLGAVTLIDSQGTVHVAWDDGSTLSLVPGEDEWVVSNEESPAALIEDMGHSADTGEMPPKEER
jgi:hypothetical protein